MISLQTQSLGKAYRLYRRPVDSLKEFLFRRKYAEELWALRDVTIAVGRGRSLGIVGDNGAGKSTLLRLLAGTISPTCGTVERNGRVSAILELGAGFHPDLSGMENIRIGCAVQGLSPSETGRRTDEIVEFSELGEFLQRPVRTYSSGMYLRLAFSVATVIDPDILIVDEHLSVGDQHFRHKCMRRILALRERGTTLVFCSHDLYSVREVCEQTLWLHEGRPAMTGATETVLQAYQDHTRKRNGEVAGSNGAVSGTRDFAEGQVFGGDTCLRQVSLEGDIRDGTVETGARLVLRVVARIPPEIRREGVHVGVLIVRNDTIWCYGTSTQMDGLTAEQALYPIGNDEYGVAFTLEPLQLLSGSYSFTVALLDDRTPHPYDLWPNVAPFNVRHGGRDVGVARIAHRWEAP